MIPSRYHRTIIRWLHDDIAKASRSRVAFVRQSGSFFFPSCCLRESKNSRYHRWSYYLTRCHYDGLTKGKMDTRSQMILREDFGQFFWMPKILPSLTKYLPKPWKYNRRSHDGLRWLREWPDVFTIRPEFIHFHNRVSICFQFRDSVTPALQFDGMGGWLHGVVDLCLKHNSIVKAKYGCIYKKISWTIH